VLSYRDYVDAITRHFANEPGILAWQLGNEFWTSYTRPDRVAMAATFVKDVASLAKANAPRTLVSVGTIGDTNGGFGEWDYSGFAAVHRVPEVDLVEAHDYFAPMEDWPKKMAMAWSVALEVHKPFFVGEHGVDLALVPDRGTWASAKFRRAATQGVAGYLLWNYVPDQVIQSYDFSDNDGMAVALGEQGVQLRQQPYPGAVAQHGLTCAAAGERGCETKGCCPGLACVRWNEFGSYLCR
jgi:hypothetical protein